jgi:hypothetical protein
VTEFVGDASATTPSRLPYWLFFDPVMLLLRTIGLDFDGAGLQSRFPQCWKYMKPSTAAAADPAVTTPRPMEAAAAAATSGAET